MSYVFGPVPSRRLGRSLGVDVVPFKTCTYDCIYCQLGSTTARTVERKEWVPLAEVLEEVKGRLARGPDYITLSGSGEPTLFSRLSELVAGIKGMTEVPVALLTNGSLLWQPEVQESLREVDLLIPSLDAGDEPMFQRVNRPHEAVSHERLVEGLIRAREACRGQYWLEVLLLAGCTASDMEVKKLAKWAALIKPDRIQLNTATRPPADPTAAAVSPQRLADLASLFDPPAEVIAGHYDGHDAGESSAGRTDILTLLRRRPCTVGDIADGLGMHRNEVVKYVEALQADGALEAISIGEKHYYRARANGAPTEEGRPPSVKGEP